MSYSSFGTSRYDRGSRRPHSFNRGQKSAWANKRSSIHPSQYVKAAKPVEPAEAYQPQHTFSDFGFHDQITQNILGHGYTTPTPIQDQAIPALMEGRDVVGIAQTGTGKTAAFLLPLLNKIALDPKEGMLIVAPTRELALQIQSELRVFMAGLNLSQCLVIGGTSMSNQIAILRRNPHVVIGTPGRLNDLIKRGAFDPAQFGNIVLDEVDRMLDIGFLKDITFLISHLPEQRQSAFFTATMNRETTDIMETFLNNPVKVSVKAQSTNDNIEQDVVRLKSGENKVDVLHSLLIQEEYSRVIVFGRTKHGINKLEQQLSLKGISVCAIHGNKTQGARQKALTMFKKGQAQALLATDVAARGIDIDNVTHVINYDEPLTYEEYIHRIGRTGRAGNMGVALTFLG